MSVSSLSRRRIADDFTVSTVLTSQDGNKRNISVKTKAKRGTLDDIPIKRVKQIMFPSLSLYSNPFYPVWMGTKDNFLATGIGLYNIYNTTLTPATEVVGVLKCTQSTASVGKGKQVLVQFPCLTQMEFAQLTNKLVTDNASSYVKYGTSLSRVNTDQESLNSPWYPFRECFLEQYDQVFTFTNNTSLDTYIELITWQPITDICEAVVALSTAVQGTINQNKTVLGLCDFDYAYYQPDNTGWNNTAQPLGNTMTFDQSSSQDSGLRVDVKANKSLFSNYKKLHKTVIKLSSGESIKYTVAIPSQILNNSFKDAITFQFVGTGASTQSVYYAPAYRKFTRFLTCRAWSHATIDTSYTTFSTINNGAFTLGDVQLSVSCTKFVKARVMPFRNRPMFINSTTNILDWTGDVIDTKQTLDTVVNAEQEQIDADQDVQAMSII